MPQVSTLPKFVQVNHVQCGDFIRCRDWANGIERYHIGRIANAEELRGTIDVDGKPMLMLTVEWLAMTTHGAYVEDTKRVLLSDLLAPDDDGDVFLVDTLRIAESEAA